MSRETKQSPAFQFYPADYLIDEKVQLMTLEQEGAYIRALAYCWREKSIPADPKILAALLGKNCSEETARVVQGCFKQDPSNASRLVHPRLDQESEKQATWKEKSTLGGIKSGQSRRNAPIKTSDPKSEPEELLAESTGYKTKGGSQMVEAEDCEMVQPKGNSSSSFSSSFSSSELEIKHSPYLESNISRISKIRDSFSEEVRELFAYWQEIHGHPQAKLDKKRENAIKARLKEGYSPERIKAAIRGIRGSPHHMGKNEHHTIYDEIELICRSGKNIDRFADLEEKTHGAFATDPWKGHQIREILEFGQDPAPEGDFLEGHGAAQFSLSEPEPRQVLSESLA